MSFPIQIGCGAAALGVLLALATADTGEARLRFAFSEITIGDVNDSDARSAIKGWVEAITRELKIAYDPVVISSSEQVAQKIRAHELDSFSITAAEYSQVSSLVDKNIILDQRDLNGGEEYLLLVHAESGISDLAGLKGRALTQYKNATQMALAAQWLETLLGAANQPGPDAFFGRRTSQAKLAKAVLPVFFRQSDACLVTRHGFETMCELNPQLGRKLRVLAASPRMVAHLIGFHKECPRALRQKFSDALFALDRSESGRQLLTLFQVERLVASDVNCLKSALDLLAAYDRLKGKPGVRK